MHFFVRNYTKGEYGVDGCKFERIGYEGFEKAVDMIGGKWKLRIIYFLAFYENLRYGELKKLAAPITHRMLSTQLKELEENELVIRIQYPKMPPKVEYRLSEKGQGLISVFEKIADWIDEFKDYKC